jgi:putative ABC transport system ATP-binding protein
MSLLHPLYHSKMRKNSHSTKESIASCKPVRQAPETENLGRTKIMARIDLFLTFHHLPPIISSLMSLSTENLTLRYGDGDKITYALNDLSLEFPDTGFFGIMGPSGSGKSSLLYLLSGLKLPTSGKVIFGSATISNLPETDRVRLRRERFGFVFQQPFLLNYLSARENVLIAAKEQDRSAPERVERLLDELGILGLANRQPAHLSGGERQRVVVARAMINEPEVIFADEPTAALDHTNGRTVIELLSRYRNRGAVIVVTHDSSMVAEADCIYHLSDGKLDHIESR